MAKGISELDVHHAADDIVTLGERPTVERIRAHLGTGSPNTVTRWLDTWWQTLGLRLRQRAIEAAAPGVPERVANLSQRLWQAALQEAGELARTQMESAQHALQDRERLLERERSTMAQQIEASQKRELEAEAKVQAAAAARKLQTAQVSQLAAQVEDLLRQRDGAYVRNERLEQELASTRLALNEATVAHQQQRTALEDHARAVEDRAHSEVDRHRMAQLSAEKEWECERAGLRAEVRTRDEQIAAATNREREAQRQAASAIVRADGLEAQLAALKDATNRFTDALRHQRPDVVTTRKEPKPRRPTKRAPSS